MNIQKAVLENFKDLNIDKQKAVLEFVKFLKYQQQTELNSVFSFKGLWADLNFSVTEEDIATVRQEMWAKFGEEIEI